MSDSSGGPSAHADDDEEVVLVARGIATAVAPEDGITDAQIGLLGSVTAALTGIDVDYAGLEPIGPDDLARALAARPDAYRHRIVHHMVLGELVLRPLPTAVSFRVAQYAEALGVRDDFVRVARRFAQGAYGLAWMDLQRNGFADHVRGAVDPSALDTGRSTPHVAPDPFEAHVDPEVADRWHGFEELDEATLGRRVWEMYDARGFEMPGTPGGAPAYLAQHDFVHVLADYGTNLPGELEVFALIARADPDPKGFAWLATLFGLFETGFIADTGFFVRDHDGGRHADAPGMGARIADAIRRGKSVCESNQRDLFEVDFYRVAPLPVSEVREMLGIPPKGDRALCAGSPGTFDLDGMSAHQREVVAQRRGGHG